MNYFNGIFRLAILVLVLMAFSEAILFKKYFERKKQQQLEKLKSLQSGSIYGLPFNYPSIIGKRFLPI